MKYEKEDGVHVHHCCIFHGCKYGDETCCVVKGKHTQMYSCEECQSMNIDMKFNVNPIHVNVQLEEYIKIKYGMKRHYLNAGKNLQTGQIICFYVNDVTKNEIQEVSKSMKNYSHDVSKMVGKLDENCKYSFNPISFVLGDSTDFLSMRVWTLYEETVRF